MDREHQIMQMNPLNLAFVGDAVQQMHIKAALAAETDGTSYQLQRRSVAYLCCEAQAYGASVLLPELTQQEQDVYRRARNAKVNTIPKHASPADYHAATGIEAVIGFCYLSGARDRAEWICIRLREICDQKGVQQNGKSDTEG